MKLIGQSFLLMISLLLGRSQTGAQIVTPQPSPLCKIEQRVGLTDITVEYSRPGLKGRKAFGDDAIIPYGSVWRTGANAATKISFSDDVMIEGVSLKKGTYAILSVPNSDNWIFRFYTYDSPGYGTYLDKIPDAEVVVMPKMVNHTFETMQIDFTNITGNDAIIAINWDNVHVPLKISVPTDKKVMASIDKVMAGPSLADYFNAGSYLHDSGKDLNKALEWVQKATKTAEPKFWQVRREALILADLGRTKEAIEAAELSKKLAMEAGNDEYVKMNEESIAEWSKKK